MKFPRLLRRGPIEAGSLLFLLILHISRFPRLLRRGPIEALAATHMIRYTVQFPRLLRRGPIEAWRGRSEGNNQAGGFPACLGGAPLKP